jgi:hypothetical protein
MISWEGSGSRGTYSCSTHAGSTMRLSSNDNESRMARKVYKHCLPSTSHSKFRMFMSCTGVFEVFEEERKVNDVIRSASVQ